MHPASASPKITILKLNLHGDVSWQYQGHVISRGPDRIVLEAFFDRPDMEFRGGTLKEGDRFVETFYNNRLYNVFEIYDRDDAGLKGWYCNVSRPAVIAETTVSWVDLALDLWVWPDGSQAVLDAEEFEALPLIQDERARARSALQELQRAFKKERPPL